MQELTDDILLFVYPIGPWQVQALWACVSSAQP